MFVVVAVVVIVSLHASTSVPATPDDTAASASASASSAAPQSRTVVSGGARFEVLSARLIRTEYAGDARFVDASTYNVVGRDSFSTVPYSTSTKDGWLTIDTGSMVLRYREGSGRFDADNLTVALTTSAGQRVEGRPWAGKATDGDAECAYGTICQAEDAVLAGGSKQSASHNGYAGTGYVSGLTRGSSATLHITGVPADGKATVQIRYASGLSASRNASLSVGGRVVATPTFAPTSGWDYWRTITVPVDLTAGDNEVTLSCSGSCGMILDTIAVTSTESTTLEPHAALGGYRRDLDLVDGQPKTNPGLLYRDGWALVDDTASDLYDAKRGSLTPRDVKEGYEDGYVFGYGSDYTMALGDLATLTGASKLLPRWTYGVWYSEYYDRTAAQLADDILPRFRSERVPVDVVALDTDYKSPDAWNGWEVDTSRFPDLKGFLAELSDEGIHNTLNVHPSISASDPQLAQAQKTAGGTLTRIGSDYVFDFSDPKQLKAYKNLHAEIAADGVESWWLDWCCRLPSSTYSASGVTPDAFLGGQYAQWTADTLGGRGFAFSRAYGSLSAGRYGSPKAVATGPWADKRSTLHFTGDAISTWATLRAEVGYTPGESASTGLSAVSNDIGGFKGGTKHAGAEKGSTQLDGDLYARWVQLGTFQPIDRLHGHHSDRLPWQYGAAVEKSASASLNLRENLVPLTYTLAEQAESTGVPVVRPLYLQYPDDPEAYAMAGSEYLYGSDVLVAPVTSSGTTATTTVWFPSGSDWTDWFTGRTYQGGTTAKITTSLDSMPVFIRSGGVVPLRSHNVDNDTKSSLTDVTLRVATGAAGSFDLFEDDGTTTNRSRSATTHIAYAETADGGVLTIDAAKGSFTGQVTKRTWTAEFSDVDRPTSVTVDGAAVAASAWSYDADQRTLTVRLAERSTGAAATVAFSR